MNYSNTRRSEIKNKKKIKAGEVQKNYRSFTLNRPFKILYNVFESALYYFYKSIKYF
jgi:hypothetical protein